MYDATTCLTSTAAALALLIACSSDVAQVGPGTGGSGTGGDVGGFGNTGNTGNTGATGGDATGGAGNTGNQGGSSSVCDQACEHATTCGFDVCTQFGIVCDGTSYECEGQCLLDTPCENFGGIDPVLVACVQACGGGGGAGGGPDAQACLQCAQPCIPDGCLQDSVCQAWGLCAINCTTPDCFDQCDAESPAASTFFEPFYACACSTCETDCEPIMDPCTGAGGGGGTGGSGGTGG